MMQKNHDNRNAVYGMIFREPELFAQLLDGFAPVEVCKGVPPTAVEDVPLPGMRYDDPIAEAVKRIRRDGQEIFVIVIAEHEDHAGGRILIRLAQRMAALWTEFEREQPRGAPFREDFKYPPVLPLVLYDGPEPWQTEQGPDNLTMDYALVDLRERSIGELAKSENALSLMLILNRLRPDDALGHVLKQLPAGYLERARANTPGRLLPALAVAAEVNLSRIGMDRSMVARAAEAVSQGRLEAAFTSLSNHHRRRQHREHDLER